MYRAYIPNNPDPILVFYIQIWIEDQILVFSFELNLLVTARKNKVPRILTYNLFKISSIEFDEYCQAGRKQQNKTYKQWCYSGWNLTN